MFTAFWAYFSETMNHLYKLSASSSALRGPADLRFRPIWSDTRSGNSASLIVDRVTRDLLGKYTAAYVQACYSLFT